MELQSTPNTELEKLGKESLLLLQGVLEQRKEQLFNELDIINSDLGYIAVAINHVVEQ